MKNSNMIREATYTGKPTVVVIDDEESVREGCRQILEAEEYRVRVAENGTEGIALVADLLPQVVLVDLKMPGMSGNEVLRKLRLIDERIIAVVITGYGTAESAVEAMKSGAYDFISKPFDDDVLLHIVVAALGAYQQRTRAGELEREQQSIKDNFAAMICHQLKAPAAAASQWIDLVKAGLAGPLTSNQQDALSKAHRRLAHLAEVIGDWLTLARAEDDDGDPESADVDIASVVRTAWDLLEDEEGWERIDFGVDVEGEICPVRGSEPLLRELFSNLLGNAVKFTSGPGRIMVSIRREGHFLVVRVRDTGMGIPEEEIPHLFDRFYRGTRSDVRRKTGSGLGLAIVKAIAELHHATIAVSSTTGEGAEFVLRLPVRRESAQCGHSKGKG